MLQFSNEKCDQTSVTGNDEIKSIHEFDMFSQSRKKQKLSKPKSGSLLQTTHMAKKKKVISGNNNRSNTEKTNE